MISGNGLKHSHGRLSDCTHLYPNITPKFRYAANKCSDRELLSQLTLEKRTELESTAEFISKLEQCLQEADENQLWLELLKEGCNIKNENIDLLWQECDELIAIMVTWVKKSKEK